MRHYLKYRRFIDLFIAGLVTAGLYGAPSSMQLFEILSDLSLDNFAISLMATAASLLGFVLAASTFLISHLQQPKFSLVRNANSYSQLPEIVSSSLWRLFISTLSGGVLVFVKAELVHWAMIFLTFIVIWTLLALATSLWIVLKIYSIPVEG